MPQPSTLDWFTAPTLPAWSLVVFVSLELGLLALVAGKGWPTWVLALPPLIVVALAVLTVLLLLSDPNTFR